MIKWDVAWEFNDVLQCEWGDWQDVVPTVLQHLASESSPKTSFLKDKL